MKLKGIDTVKLKDLNIEKIAQAIEADAAEPLEGLRESLAQAKAGVFAALRDSGEGGHPCIWPGGCNQNDMTENRFCLQCDDGTLLEHGARDLSFTRHARTHTVPQVFGWHCPVCKDCHFDAGQAQRYGAAMDALSAQGNLALRMLGNRVGFTVYDKAKENR